MQGLDPAPTQQQLSHIHHKGIYKAFHSSPIIDCYCRGAVPNAKSIPQLRGYGGSGIWFSRVVGVLALRVQAVGFEARGRGVQGLGFRAAALSCKQSPRQTPGIQNTGSPYEPAIVYSETLVI